MPLRACKWKAKTLEPWCAQCHPKWHQGTWSPQLFLLFSYFHSNKSKKLLPLANGKEYLLCMGLFFKEIKRPFQTCILCRFHNFITFIYIYIYFLVHIHIPFISLPWPGVWIMNMRIIKKYNWNLILKECHPLMIMISKSIWMTKLYLSKWGN